MRMLLLWLALVVVVVSAGGCGRRQAQRAEEEARRAAEEAQRAAEEALRDSDEKLSGLQAKLDAVTDELETARAEQTADDKQAAPAAVEAVGEPLGGAEPQAEPAAAPAGSDDPAVRLEACRVVVELMGRDQRELTSAEKQTLDARLVELADLYRQVDDRQRAEIRDWFRDVDTWPLMAAIRRWARKMQSAEDIVWLRRGLALAAIENSRFDYRDVIVSLVILRYGAERVDIETAAEFDEAMKISAESVHGVMKNARNHAAKDIKATLEAFGPREWARELP